MTRNKISVIIPLYNAKKYIGKCVESVLSQTHENIELIIINDGSTDASAETVSNYLSDPRILYTKQENSGVSSALNRGLDHASGDFIAFMGDDDYIEPDMYEKMLNSLEREDADVAVCDFNLVYEDGRDKQLKYSATRNETIDLLSDPHRYFAKCCINPKSNNYIWSRLYKGDIVRNSGIRFEKLAIGEDTLFNFKLLAYIHKAVFLEDGFYNYLQRPGSVIHNAAKKQALAKAYTEQFDSIVDCYRGNNCKHLEEFLPLLAFTRMRSTFFYSRLSGMGDSEIIESMVENFSGRHIAGYLTGNL